MNKQLEEFYIKNQPKLGNKLSHSAGSVENAEDVVQEAFSLALKYWDSYDPKRYELGTWFGTILNNSLRLFKRNERSMGTYVELDEENAGSYDLSDADYDTVERIKSCIDEYEGDHKQVLYLYFLKEYKPKEICAVVDMKYKHIEVFIHRFKQEMIYRYGS